MKKLSEANSEENSLREARQTRRERPDDSLVDEVQRRMDAVVDAAVEWHQSENGDEHFITSEALGTAIDRLLELREQPSSSDVSQTLTVENALVLETESSESSSASTGLPEAAEIDEYHARSDHDAITKVWVALGITEYTGKAVWEEVAALKARIDFEKTAQDFQTPSAPADIKQFARDAAEKVREWLLGEGPLDGQAVNEVASIIELVFSNYQPSAEPSVTEAQKCVWYKDDWTDGDLWETTCGQSFQFNDGGPQENQFKFCYHCGKPLEELVRSETEVVDA